MQSEYIFQVITKGIVSSLVLVCHSYIRLEGRTSCDKLYEVLYASVWNPLCILPESENFSQGSKLVYFPLRIHDCGHLFSACIVLCCNVEFVHTLDRHTQWSRTYCWQVSGITHEAYETEYRQECRFPADSYCTFYDCGKMKGKVYRKNPNVTETLQSNLLIVQT